MPHPTRQPEERVAVLVDCENVPPEILEQSLRYAAQFGRVVIRRGYGNQNSLAHRWQEALVQWAFTPFLQFQVVTGKNTTDIALALDALEILFDSRADTFCLVTSDSDFAYLCRKLRERGASVSVVGEAKTPDALRNASDQFFEWRRAEPGPQVATAKPPKKKKKQAKAEEPAPTRPEAPRGQPRAKQQPGFVVDAVALLAADAVDGGVDLSLLGEYLRRTNSGFTPNTYGHSSLLQMLKSYDKLTPTKGDNGGWLVRLVDTAAVKSSPAA